MTRKTHLAFPTGGDRRGVGKVGLAEHSVRVQRVEHVQVPDLNLWLEGADRREMTCRAPTAPPWQDGAS